MSHTKKNSNRDPAAQEKDSTINRLVTKFLEMQEPDYTRNVVIPVLEGEGFHRIDFHHGATEVGKDLIFFKEASFGRKSLVVAVVKTDKLSKTSSGQEGLPVILVQVAQAQKNEVISWDGTKKRPDEVLVILADDPSHDLITSSPDGFRECVASGVTFIHGSEIASSLLKHRPEIAEQILQSKLDASQFLRAQPTNIPLLKALNSNESVKVETIFTDLDATVGSTTITDALRLFPAPSSAKIRVKEDEWRAIEPAFQALERHFGTVLQCSLNDAKALHFRSNAKANSKKNIELRKSVSKYIEGISDWAEGLFQTYGGHAHYLNELNSKSNKKAHSQRSCIGAAYDTVDEIKNAIGAVHVRGALGVIPLPLGVRTLALYEGLSELHSSLTAAAHDLIAIDTSILHPQAQGAFENLIRQIKRDEQDAADFLVDKDAWVNRANQYVPHNDFELLVDNQKLGEQQQAFLDKLVSWFASQDIVADKSFARMVLSETKNYLSLLETFRTTPALSGFFAPKAEGHNNVEGCVLALLDSGIDILITGVAGSGKSTTLEMFAHRRAANAKVNEEIIFLPLARVGEVDNADAIENSIQTLCTKYASLLQGSSPGVTAKFVKQRLDRSKKLTLILDGFDEAAGLTNWLVALISALKSMKKDDLQVVASSRFDVESLTRSVGFLNLVLLPFKHEQIDRFISAFLSNSPSLAAEVINHLKANPNLYSVAQTPLMSTILCVLARNGVTLPETKSALYRERFELLWGTYDASKQVRRVLSSRSALEDVSKKIAYFLHSKKKRSAPCNDILASIKNTLRRKYRAEVIEKAMLELERPCNVLVSGTEGGLEFGHLSYQEYLAGDELYTCRQSEIVNYLADPWWRGALVHVAMKADDIGTLIEERLVQTGSVGGAYTTLSAMLEVCDDSQKGILRTLLKKQASLDKLGIVGDEDFDSFN